MKKILANFVSGIETVLGTQEVAYNYFVLALTLDVSYWAHYQKFDSPVDWTITYTMVFPNLFSWVIAIPFVGFQILQSYVYADLGKTKYSGITMNTRYSYAVYSYIGYSMGLILSIPFILLLKFFHFQDRKDEGEWIMPSWLVWDIIAILLVSWISTMCSTSTGITLWKILGYR